MKTSMDDSYFKSDDEFYSFLGYDIYNDESSHPFQPYSNPSSNFMKNTIPPYIIEKIIKGSSEANKDSTSNNSNKITFIISYSKGPENKRRGRQVTANALLNSKRGRHIRTDEDNVLTKIHVHFLNFLIFFLNDCIFAYFKNREIKLSKFDHGIKSKISSKHFNKMKNSTIYDILIETAISSKYKTQKKDINETIVKSLNEIPWFNTIFQMSFLDLFHRYYINEKKKVNKIFVIDREITLSNGTKPYYSLLEKNKDIKNIIIKTTENNYNYDVNFTDILKFSEKTEEYFEFNEEN